MPSIKFSGGESVMRLQTIIYVLVWLQSGTTFAMPPKRATTALIAIKNHASQTYWGDDAANAVYFYKAQYEEIKIRIDDEFDTTIRKPKPGQLYLVYKGERGIFLYDPTTYIVEDTDKKYSKLNYSTAFARLSPPTPRYHYPGSRPPSTPSRSTPPRLTPPRSEPASPTQAVLDTTPLQELGDAAHQPPTGVVLAPPAAVTPVKSRSRIYALIAALTFVITRLYKHHSLIQEVIQHQQMTDEQHAACWFFDRWLIACVVRLHSLLSLCTAI